ncbi:MAG: alanine racemase [Ignavibacteriaceae bacterium]|nr:alanine racemase [Ignavibacteriaceae bacterium]
MATLNIDTKQICENIIKMDKYLSKKKIKWTLVTKMLCGYKPVLEKIITSDYISNLHSVGDSRITNLKIIKDLRPDIVTMYVKPPAINQVKNIVKYADISLNTRLHTLEALNEEAGSQGKKHRVIVMVEMGELREGVVRDDVLRFYEKAFTFTNIEIIGIGTNLGCMYGVEPTYDKLIQLSLYKQLLEIKFGHKLDLVSGGSSITLPLLENDNLPKGVNHFRIGEAALLGVLPTDGTTFRNLSNETFDFSADVLEINKKSAIPDGAISNANVGHHAEIATNGDSNKETYRCIVDIGMLDVDVNDLIPKDDKLTFVGTTSDMTVYDVGDSSLPYSTNNQLHFRPSYMGVARLMNSRYITKHLV